MHSYLNMNTMSEGRGRALGAAALLVMGGAVALALAPSDCGGDSKPPAVAARANPDKGVGPASKLTHLAPLGSSRAAPSAGPDPEGDGDGPEVPEALKNFHPEIQRIILSMRDDREKIKKIQAACEKKDAESTVPAINAAVRELVTCVDAENEYGRALKGCVEGRRSDEEGLTDVMMERCEDKLLRNTEGTLEDFLALQGCTEATAEAEAEKAEGLCHDELKGAEPVLIATLEKCEASDDDKMAMLADTVTCEVTAARNELDMKKAEYRDLVHRDEDGARKVANLLMKGWGVSDERFFEVNFPENDDKFLDELGLLLESNEALIPSGGIVDPDSARMFWGGVFAATYKRLMRINSEQSRDIDRRVGALIKMAR
jgi:hypothetical protein